MNKETWNNIFTKWVADFNAIDLLQAHGIVGDEEVARLKNKLLVDIIITIERGQE